VQRSQVVALLAVIVIVGAVPRVYRIHVQGAESHDEAYLTLESVFIGNVISVATRRLVGAGRTESLTVGDISDLGVQPSYAKPLFNAAVLLFLVLGVAPQYVSPIVAAFWGVLTIPMMFALGKRLWGNKGGLLAAAVISFSGYHAFSSRIGTAESTAMFLLALALYAYFASWEDAKRSAMRLLVVGAALSLPVLANYKTVLTVGVFVLVAEACRAIRNRRFAYREYAWLVAGFLLVPVSIELAYRIGIYAMHASGSTITQATFWQQFSYLVFEKRGLSERLGGERGALALLHTAGMYLNYWWHAEGPLTLGLIGVGCGYAAMRFVRDGFAEAVKDPIITILISGVILVALWSTQVYVVPRAMAHLCVWTSLLTVQGLLGLWATIGNRRPMSSFGASYIIGAGLLVLFLLMGLTVRRIGLSWFSRPSSYVAANERLSDIADDTVYAEVAVSARLMMPGREILSLVDSERRAREVLPGSIVFADSITVVESLGSSGHTILGRYRARVSSSRIAMWDDQWVSHADRPEVIGVRDGSVMWLLRTSDRAADAQ